MFKLLIVTHFLLPTGKKRRKGQLLIMTPTEQKKTPREGSIPASDDNQRVFRKRFSFFRMLHTYYTHTCLEKENAPPAPGHDPVWVKPSAA